MKFAMVFSGFGFRLKIFSRFLNESGCRFTFVFSGGGTGSLGVRGVLGAAGTTTLIITIGTLRLWRRLWWLVAVSGRRCVKLTAELAASELTTTASELTATDELGAAIVAIGAAAAAGAGDVAIVAVGVVLSCSYWVVDVVVGALVEVTALREGARAEAWAFLHEAATLATLRAVRTLVGAHLSRDHLAKGSVIAQPKEIHNQPINNFSPAN